MPARPVEGRRRGAGSCSGKSTESGRCFHSRHQPASSAGGDRKFPIYGNPKFLTFGLSFKEHRAALLQGWQSGTRRADVRMGDPEVVEALSGPGRLEDGVVAALRGEPPDNPPLDRDGDLKPVCGGIRRGRRWRTSWIPTRRSSTRVSRRSRCCRRSGCSTRSARRAIRAGTSACRSMSVRHGHASWLSGSRRRFRLPRSLLARARALQHCVLR